jgi:hypothetical protein
VTTPCAAPRRRIALGLLLLAACAPSAALAADVTLDGRPLDGAVVSGGRLMIPFSAPLEAIGAQIVWDDRTGVATATYNDLPLVTIKTGSAQAAVVGSILTLSAAPVQQNHVAYIPVKALAEISTATVTLDPEHESAVVTGWDLAGIHEAGATAGRTLLGVWAWILAAGGLGSLLTARAVFVVQIRSARRARGELPS